ncbi:MAG: NUDIX domain-containing protein [Chloroflexota bacterium]|nr:NUDIX domain-containing protein [Chloroflexota bacterium]
MFTVGVFALLFDEDQRILLCHRRDYDLWNLPGGGLETGETPWDGVIREVLEETGLHVAIERLAGVYSKQEINEIVFSFVCTIAAGHLTLNDEADRIEYFALNEIPSNTSRKQIERIHDAIENESGLTLKAQHGLSSKQPAGRLGYVSS